MEKEEITDSLGERVSEINYIIGMLSVLAMSGDKNMKDAYSRLIETADKIDELINNIL